MRIRKFRKEDATAVSEIIKKAWIFNNSSYYSPETIKDEIEKNTPEMLLERSKAMNYFVATEKDNI